LLGVPAGLLDEYGAVHPAVAGAMAAGVRQRLGATYGVAVTGVAGPEPQDGRTVGTIFVGVATPTGKPRVVSPELPVAGGGAEIREVVRRMTVVHALEQLRRVILGLDAGPGGRIEE
jgi:nicotinamide-nucleotide amidase